MHRAKCALGSVSRLTGANAQAWMANNKVSESHLRRRSWPSDVFCFIVFGECFLNSLSVAGEGIYSER